MGSKAKSVIGIYRPPFLLLPVVLIAVGAAAAAYEGSFSWLHSVVALVGLLAAHASVNALNEASDVSRGIDKETERTPFSGGSGTLLLGDLSIKTAYVWGYVALAVAAAVGVYFLVELGLVVLPILIAGLVAIVAYTDLLARVRLGEIFAGLGLGTLPVLGAGLVQEGVLGPALIWVSVPAFFMTFNLLLLNEFPDEKPDTKYGRKNLVLALGRKGAARAYALAVVLVPLTIVAAVVLKALPPLTLVACAASLPCVPALKWALTKPEENPPIPSMGGNVVWNLATNAVLAITLVLSTG